jgi:hypothetical protein
MRDEQVRRYARHIMLPDVGEGGQEALMASSAVLGVPGSEPAAMVAGSYLAAGGVGSLVVQGATEAECAELAAHGPDTHVALDGEGHEVVIAPPPAWWPGADGDATALAFWRGGLAATAWMANLVDR